MSTSRPDTNDPSARAEVHELRAEIRANEVRHQAILDTIVDAVITIDPEGTILFANVAVERLFGYTPEELLGANVRILMPEPDRSAHDGYLKKYRETHVAKIIGIGRRVVGLRKDGSTFPLHLAVSEAKTKRGLLYTGILRDLSEEVRAEQELHATKERLELAVSGTAEGIFDWNRVTGERYLSARAIELMGGKEGIADLVDEAEYAKFLAAADQCLVNGTPIDVRVRATLPTNEVRWLRIRGTGVGDGSARIVGSIGDVTTEQSALQALEEMASTLAERVQERTRELSLANEELERASSAKDEFLANMSHELRTPLNAILGLGEALMEGIYGPLNAEQQRTLKTVEESARHLLALINDILDLAKINAGRLELDSEPVNVFDLCASCLSYIRPEAIHKKIYLSVSEVDRDLVVQSDARRLKQILINLLSNAVKFTPVGGRISLTVWPKPDADEIEFQVEDTGIGIPEDKLAEIFLPFRQVDSGHSRQYEGTGLGLALVSRLVEAFGGSLRVHSNLGTGSKFTIVLPCVDGVAEPEEVLLAPTNVRKALIIEDSKPDADRLQRFLKERNIESVILRTTETALDVLRSDRPDVILLDLLLPNESGWRFIERLRDDPEVCDIPVIVVSVVDEQPQSARQGAAIHITKPITREDIERALARLSNPEVKETAPDSPPKHTILLAEDNEANILTIGDYLRRHGLRILVARTGVEAVDLAHSEKPDLILMDMQMPQMDGFEAIKRIRAGGQSEVPIFALTALAMRGDRERCLSAGANDYIPKPVRLKDLLTAIDERLNGRERV